ncbi:hypothetical protein Y032_0001g337 [Ancylostoma ceylanicum]|nr:hypothetical protein Y032_0001g337 [Ancylostoma ceylanicum]
MVAQLTLLLVAFVMSDASFQDILKVYDHCYADAEALNSLTGNATPTLIQLPEWCMAMRHDVAPCLAEAIQIEDDGSVASRGNVLLSAYERTGNTTILTHVKLYHYGCVYNNWYSYAEDEPCYQNMLSECVFGSSSCYYMPCEMNKENSYKALGQWHREPTSASVREYDYLITSVLVMSLFTA